MLCVRGPRPTRSLQMRPVARDLPPAWRLMDALSVTTATADSRSAGLTSAMCGIVANYHAHMEDVPFSIVDEINSCLSRNEMRVGPIDSRLPLCLHFCHELVRGTDLTRSVRRDAQPKSSWPLLRHRIRCESAT